MKDYDDTPMFEDTLAANFTMESMRQIAQETQTKYIREKYESILWQIQIAAENRRFATTFPASECPLELVSWLLKQDFKIVWEVKQTGAHIVIHAANEYIEADAKSVTVAW